MDENLVAFDGYLYAVISNTAYVTLCRRDQYEVKYLTYPPSFFSQYGLQIGDNFECYLDEANGIFFANDAEDEE
jgi:hypothetical protein